MNAKFFSRRPKEKTKCVGVLYPDDLKPHKEVHDILTFFSRKPFL